MCGSNYLSHDTDVCRQSLCVSHALNYIRIKALIMEYVDSLRNGVSYNEVILYAEFLQCKYFYQKTVINNIIQIVDIFIHVHVTVHSLLFYDCII